MITTELICNQESPYYNLFDKLNNLIPNTYHRDIHIQCCPQSLLISSDQFKSPLSLSYIDHKASRLTRTLSTQQPLWRSFGKKISPPFTVFDLTAGLGQDSFILASLGADVVSIEADPLIYALLDINISALKYLKPQIKWQAIHADSLVWLKQQTDPLPYVYIDPFFHLKPNSLPHKNIQWIQFLSMLSPDNGQVLFEQALKISDKIVVKRYKNAASINHLKPNSTIYQKSSRFDCYYVSSR